MSLYRAKAVTFQAVDNLLQRDEETFDCEKVVKKMLKLPGAVQQMIITYLIYLYSLFAPAERRTSYYANKQYRTEESARRGMYHLRQVVHALAHNDGDQPRAERYFKVKLSVWQEHLLQHFERLAPFPQDATTEEEVFDFMWGNTWREDLNLKLDCNFLKLPQLANHAYELGISLPQIVRLCQALQDSQDQSEPITPLTINQICKELEYVTGKIQERCNCKDLTRPRIVKIGRYYTPSPSQNRFPSFLAQPDLAEVAEADRFVPSRLLSAPDDFVDKFKNLTHFDNSSTCE
jgi:hypothetical protein